MELCDRQSAYKRLLANSDFRILSNDLRAIAKGAARKQLDCNPLTEQVKAAEQKILRAVITQIIPNMIQDVINAEPDAIDGKVEPAKRFDFFKWFFGSND